MTNDREREAVGSTTTALAEESAGIRVAGYAAQAARAPLRPFTFERRAPGPKDVLFDILYCGVCHSDIHQVRGDWGDVMPSIFPMVPGHEIVGKVEDRRQPTEAAVDSAIPTRGNTRPAPRRSSA
jgi:Alcohol dehydrogenase GroES-like domain